MRNDRDRLDQVQAALEEFDEVDVDELPDDERERYDQLDAEYDQLSKLAKGRHSAEQRARSGVVIRTDRDYSLDYGMVKPGSSKTSSNSSDKPDKDPLALSAPTLSDLGKAATTALSQAVEAQPDKALAMLAALLEVGPASPWSQHRPGRLKIVAPGDTSGVGYQSTETRSYGEAFEEYAAMKAVDLKKALARLVAGAVDISQEWLPKNADMRIAALDAFGVDPTPHFDVDSFFSAGRKPIIAAAYKEMTGQDLKDGKKADMVAIAVDVAKKTGWLPEYLRTASYKPKKVK
ncbi:hypothetical protein V7794_22815 [Rhizobium laguerreae]